MKLNRPDQVRTKRKKQTKEMKTHTHEGKQVKDDETTRRVREARD